MVSRIFQVRAVHLNHFLKLQILFLEVEYGDGRDPFL